MKTSYVMGVHIQRGKIPSDHSSAAIYLVVQSGYWPEEDMLKISLAIVILQSLSFKMPEGVTFLDLVVSTKMSKFLTSECWENTDFTKSNFVE